MNKIINTAVIVGMTLGGAMDANAGMWERVKSVVGLETEPKAPTIKVLIAKELDGAMLEVKGKYNIYDPYKNSRLGTRFFSKSNYVQPVTEGIKWGEVFPGVFQMVVVPDDPDTTSVVNGVEYRGSLYVYQVENSLYIINEVPVEDYVHSIMSVQFDNPVSQEVMCAMAIALRTDACFAAVSKPDAYWHVDASNVGYTGYAVTKRSRSLDDVMASTRHLILSKTRGFQGSVTPIKTCCLEQEYSGDNAATAGWNVSKAQVMASKGQNAAKILQAFFPESTVEMADTLEGSVASGREDGRNSETADLHR